MRPTLKLFVFLIVMLLSTSQTMAGSLWWIETHLGGPVSTIPSGVSADGSVVVGEWFDWGGSHPFRWTQSEGLVYIVQTSYGSASDISVDGSVVVGRRSNYSPDSGGPSEAYRWTQSSGTVGLGYLTGDDDSMASGVSSDGTVVVGASAQYMSSPWEAFRWTQSGGMIGLGNLPGSTGSIATDVSANGSVVVGKSGNEAFRWTQSGGMAGLSYLPGQSLSQASGVSSDGSVVVGRSGDEAFRWTQSGGMVGLGFLPGKYSSHPYGVSANGSVVVGTSQDVPFIWDSTHGMRNLEDVLSNEYGINLNGWRLKSATNISADGTVIIGLGSNNECNKEIFAEDAWIAKIHPSILPSLFVDGDIADSGNGTSWLYAFKTIQEAIDAANADDIIWVKRGTYVVTSTIDVDKSVSIYGGFDGTETYISERDFRINTTTVDGQDINTCFHLRADATIDGFTITHGQTNWGGGGIYISSSAPVVTNCIFNHNNAGSNGGGAIHSWNASPTITNSIFHHNDGGSNGGGAIFNTDCPDVTIMHCTFSNNDGGSSGGGAIYNFNSSTDLTNSILWGDSAVTGDEVYNDAGAMTITHCDLSGGVAGIFNAGGGTINDNGGNFDSDPWFGTAYHLQAYSGCIDIGTHVDPEILNTDMDGETRFKGCFYDLGADEFHDADGDLMPDWWERRNGFNEGSPGDAGIDSDAPQGDGLTNLEEYEYATDPTDPDTDNDGINDGLEVALWASLNCTSLGCSECWNCDIDGDGQANNLLDEDADGDGMLDGNDPDPITYGGLPPCILDSRFTETTLSTGLAYYTDRAYTLTSVPSPYVGMDTILTPNDDRNLTDASDYLTFEMPNDGTVYVAYDSRATSLPSWMSGFSDTGDRIYTSLSTQPYLKVYQRSYSSGDCVNLGANKAPGFTGGTVSNYIVFYGTSGGPPPCILDSRFKETTLSTGLAYYTDRAYTLTSVPSPYVGMDAILTPNDDRNLTDASDYLTFEMPSDGTVYVAYDSRATSLPSWMSGFSDTGDRIYTSLSTQPYLKVYERAYTAGDCVNLGANKAPGFTGGTVSNYIVFYGTSGGPPPCILDSRFKETTLSTGLAYYTDRAYTLTTVPSPYVGMDAILTPNDDRNLTDASDYLTFEMPNDGTVYVAYDSRATSLPSWMSGFSDTGDRIYTSLSTQPYLRVYQRSYASGDCVNLGANKASGFAGGIVSNYVVFYGTGGGPPPCILDSRFDQATLGNGLAYYTDRAYTLTSVPSPYVGMDAILTPNDDRNLTDASDYLTFEMPYDGTVYVAYDSRATSLPSWMSGFSDTGDSLATSLSTQPSLKIYSQNYNVGDCINFGANKAPDFTGGTVSNYIVFY